MSIAILVFLQIFNSKFVSLCDDEVIEVSSDESTSGCKADSEEDIGLQNALCESFNENRYVHYHAHDTALQSLQLINHRHLGEANVSMCL